MTYTLTTHLQREGISPSRVTLPTIHYWKTSWPFSYISHLTFVIFLPLSHMFTQPRRFKSVNDYTVVLPIFPHTYISMIYSKTPVQKMEKTGSHVLQLGQEGFWKSFILVSITTLWTFYFPLLSIGYVTQLSFRQDWNKYLLSEWNFIE